MADGFAGRQIAFTWNGSPVKGVREKGINMNGDAIDVTSDEDSGKRTLLAVTGQDQVDITLSGVTKDTILRAAFFGGDAGREQAVTITYPNGDVISGNFWLQSYQETGPYNDATTFSATLQSTGDFSYTEA